MLEIVYFIFTIIILITVLISFGNPIRTYKNDMCVTGEKIVFYMIYLSAIMGIMIILKHLLNINIVFNFSINWNLQGVIYEEFS